MRFPLKRMAPLSVTVDHDAGHGVAGQWDCRGLGRRDQGDAAPLRSAGVEVDKCYIAEREGASGPVHAGDVGAGLHRGSALKATSRQL